jgi:hypothetical protein
MRHPVTRYKSAGCALEGRFYPVISYVQLYVIGDVKQKRKFFNPHYAAYKFAEDARQRDSDVIWYFNLIKTQQIR